HTARILAVALAFIVAARISLTFAFAGVVAPLWLPAGISLAAILLLGPSIWPGVAAGAFLANLSAGATIPFCLSATAANTLEALLSTWLLRMVAGFDPRLARPRDVIALASLAAIASPVISASIGVSALCVTRMAPWPAFARNW